MAESMNNLEKLKVKISEKTKITRHRRTLLIIHITGLAWIVEFFGFAFAALAAILLPGARILQAIPGLVYFIIAPSAYLINSSDVKAFVMENRLFISFTNKYYPFPIKNASNN